MDKYEKGGIVVTILIQLGFMFAGFLEGRFWFYPDNLIFIALAIIAYVYFDRLRLNIGMLILANVFFVLHALGFADFYALNLLGIPYDKILHWYGFVVVSILLMRVLPKRMKLTNLKKFLIIVLMCVGIGGITEMVEFSGFYFLGEGEGFFFFGAGDGGSKLQGSWQNAMTDMMANLLGAITGVILVLVSKKFS
ncbi:hypothetical protein ACFLZX_00380 [Nanoarchaeota archaeon]